VVALGQPTAAPVRYVDEPAFPELRADPDAVAKVTIETPDGSFTLVRQDEGRWVAPDRFDYPVAIDQVRDLVVALADMRLVERKTSLAERYERLELRDLNAEGAKSKLVRVESADGEVLAEAIIGKQRQRLTGHQSSGTYIRRPSEAQTWLASGSVQPDLEVQNWLESEVVELPGESLRRVEVTPAQGSGYTILRDEKGGELRLEGLSEDEQLKADADLGRLANALSSVTMEDVKPRDEIEWPDEQPTARFVTFDGLQVSVRLAKIGEEHFAAFDTEQVEPAVAVTADGEGEAADAAASEAPGTGDGAAESGKTRPAGAQAAESPTREATAPEASDDSVSETAGDESAQETASNPAEDEPAKPDATALQAKLGKWAYKVPEFLFNRLTTARGDLVEPKDGTS
jgi:Domain of unknown function (DUF4340)